MSLILFFVFGLWFGGGGSDFREGGYVIFGLIFCFFLVMFRGFFILGCLGFFYWCFS